MGVIVIGGLYNVGMKVVINEVAKRIVEALGEAGYEAWIVGGAVRDTLLGRATKDWDVTTSATPTQVLPLFANSFYDNNYGTVMVAGKHLKDQFGLDDSSAEDEAIFDITTYRTEHGYSDKRRPDSVSWGKSIDEDLARRDLTINAIAIRPSNQQAVNSKQVGDGGIEIVDPFGGQHDLKNGVIRAVGEPKARFEEDALRILRAVRLGAELGFVIESKTLAAIQEKAANLGQISAERIGGEVMRVLASPNPADGVRLMASTGILKVVIPELLLAKDVKQGGHHIYDVFTHSVEALGACPSPDPVVRLATLLHDVDKPVVVKPGGERGMTFYGHEVSGARTAKRIAERLKLSKRDQERIFTLVRWHMFVYESKMTDASIRRFIRRVGRENIHDMMALRVGDRVGGGSKATSWRLTELQKRIGEQFYEPLSLKDLKINGGDVMRILGIAPGRRVGEILNQLFEEVIEDSHKNDKEYLEKRVGELA